MDRAPSHTLHSHAAPFSRCRGQRDAKGFKSLLSEQVRKLQTAARMKRHAWWVAVLSCTACLPPPEAPEATAPAVQSEALTADQSEAAFAAFDAWLARWLHTDPSVRDGLIPAGLSRAQARAAAMDALIQADPQEAIARAVQPASWHALPSELQPFVERWVDGTGRFGVVAGMSEDPAAPPPPLRRVLELSTGEHFDAFVYGRREGMASRSFTRAHGVALNGHIALSDSPIRVLFPDEPHAELPFAKGSHCPISKKVGDPSLEVSAGDTLFLLCSCEHAPELAQQLISVEDAEAAAAASGWDFGPKSILFIRVDFSDMAGDPVSASAAQSLVDTTTSNFYQAASYGQTSMTATVTPTLRMPQTKAYYATAGQDQLRADALTAAADAGYPYLDYTHEVTAFKQIYGGWAGMAYVGTRGVWLNGYFNLATLGHELGHNYGVMHANYWSAGNDIIGAGSNVEYGSPFDMMAVGGGAGSHFNAWFKSIYGWFAPPEVQTVTSSGTYRIQQLEQPVSSGLHAIKVPRNDGQKDYWVELRQAFTSNPWSMSGVNLNWGFNSIVGSELLDMNPGGTQGAKDSPLTSGRSFTDGLTNITFTTLNKAGTTPEAIDVVVNLGPFPGNQPPTLSLSASTATPAAGMPVTFTATASDPDGDALAYAWDFEDNTFVPSAPAATHTFAAATTASVRCTVSDMKGHTVTKSVLITVGAPSGFVLSGSVTQAGVGVGLARITDGTRSTFSDSDGKYALGNVPLLADAGTPSVTLTASKFDLAVTPAFTQPLMVTGSRASLDFTAANKPGYNISGSVKSGSTGIPGVVVTDGTRTASSDAAGNFTLTAVPNGRYTLTASKAGWLFAPSGLIEVWGGNTTGVSFYPQGQNITGTISGVTTAPVVSDGVRTVTATAAGPNWFYALNGVPNGDWNVTATLAGWTLTPQFTNPVTVAGTYVPNKNFAGTMGASHAISGVITTGATPLPGVTVSAGTASSVTDVLGRYILSGLADGAYTLTPVRAGYTFNPATLGVTLSGADVTGKNFTTTTVNLPPTVATPASASPTMVSGGTTTALSVLGADDTGEAQLTYTWSVLSGFMPPTYSDNGTNSAKHTTATFHAAGTYTFDVAITDAGGLSAHSQVQVTVQGKLVSLTVVPGSASVLTGASVYFNAQGKDQFGNYFYPGPIGWSVSGGGTLAPTGQFTAGMTQGGPYTVTATAGTFMATALVTVTGMGAPAITMPAAATPNPVTATTTSLSVTATDDGGEPGLIYIWSVASGPAPVTFTPNGTNAAKASTATFTQAGTYQLVVTVQDGMGNIATSAVTVTVVATASAVTVSPQMAAVTAGQTQQFTADVADQFGAPLLPPPAIAWSVAGGGAVDMGGLFTAGVTPGGPFTLTAGAGAVQGTASITVMAAPDTTPPVVSITAPVGGMTFSSGFTVTATASDDVMLAGVSLSVDGSAMGELTAAPLAWTVDASALMPGTHQLVAHARDAAGNTADSASVPFIVPAPTSDQPPAVSLSGVSNGATVSGVLMLTATASDDLGVVSVELRVDGAAVKTLTSAPYGFSLDTATLAAGSHTLVAVATDTKGQSASSAPVTIVIAAPQPMMMQGQQIRGVCGCSGGPAGPLLLIALALLRRRQPRETRSP
jgi:MYXO-CTERM domain-containing protein